MAGSSRAPNTPGLVEHRLYLDTGDLLAIADAKVPSRLIADLKASMAESATRLLLSRFHIQDAVSTVDQPTRERFIRSIEGFQPVLVVVDGPDEVEPLTAERADIDTQPSTNFRALVMAPAAGPWLAEANRAQDQISEGDRAAQTVRRRTPAEPRRVAAQQLLLQCTVTLIRGWKGEDPETVLAFWESRSVPLASDERVAVLARLEAVREMKRALGPLASDEAEGTELLRLVSNLSATSPGRLLKAQAISHNQGELKRTRKRSDWLDVEHVAHFPYVDVATCDKNTWHGIKGARSGEWPRKPVIFRTGRLPDVVDALRELPQRMALATPAAIHRDR